jgi:hypothetical protein
MIKIYGGKWTREEILIKELERAQQVGRTMRRERILGNLPILVNSGKRTKVKESQGKT